MLCVGEAKLNTNPIPNISRYNHMYLSDVLQDYIIKPIPYLIFLEENLIFAVFPLICTSVSLFSLETHVQ
jgi:hypothetical protein